MVIAVSRSAAHRFSKASQCSIRLIAGIGVEGDAHAGETVQHRSRIKRDRAQPNLRQVHLLHEELLEELRDAGFTLKPGAIGENITTRGIDLLALPRGTLLRLGSEAVVEITGLRNPCVQIDRFQAGLMAAVIERRLDGSIARKAGVMGVVRSSGKVRVNDSIVVELPRQPHTPLEAV